MRTMISIQKPVWPQSFSFEQLDELRHISDFLFQCQELEEAIMKDLLDGCSSHEGFPGMSPQQVLRALFVKQANQFSYRELAFHIADSLSYRAFCLYPPEQPTPRKSALADNIKRISAQTLEDINDFLVRLAKDENLEDGQTIRFDATPTETNIHPPTDASLLRDSVQSLNSILRRTDTIVSHSLVNHCRSAKKIAYRIQNTKKKAKKNKLYRKLVTLTEKTVGYAVEAIHQLEFLLHESDEAIQLLFELKSVLELTNRVISQTERRVFMGEKLPPEEKVVSLFESHTDILAYQNKTIFGHKVYLTTGKKLILDCIVEEGNPNDTTMTIGLVQRQIDLYGQAPKQVAFDGAFVSKSNVEKLKKMGVKDIAPTKRRGIPVSDLTKSNWVYNKLKKWRAGVEGKISWLKRCFGWRRCNWSGFDSFKSWIWSGVVVANLFTFARHKMALEKM